MEIRQVADRLNDLCNTIPALIRQEDATAFAQRPAPSKWSKKEILGHLIDSATNNHRRFVSAVIENEPVIAYDGDQWVAAQQYQQLDLEQLLQFWESYNRHLAAIIVHIPATALQRPCKVNAHTSLTIHFLITDYLVHLEHHLRQLVAY
ncbi:DinB family protein [Chitinophaga nivalis]|uniref:DinB family protein n=1 Tax=Chitinophaga nivalis TaxID=2991709 RepID=A0ABT3IQB8_9BACT|nr:DinB family protein [Chitinophaga nivalis]MCW3464157.1 DinB family protein [Chitinophaga nivalis]MCW3486153.1 DinB family protein [Chitinophaga nivalis]